MEVSLFLKRKVGIYKITVDQKFYIGSSKDLRSRLLGHLNHLKKNKHHSRYMQRCYNKHGEKSLSFEVLEMYDIYDETYLRTRELEIMNELNPVFNSTTPITYHHSDDMKQRIRATLKRKYKSGEIVCPSFGTGHKLDIYDIHGVKIKQGIRSEEAVKFLGLSNRSVINSQIRKDRFVFRNNFIVLPSDKTLEDYKQSIIKHNAIVVPIFSVDKDLNITRSTSSSVMRVKYKLLESKNFVYYSNIKKKYYTFLGLLHLVPFFKET